MNRSIRNALMAAGATTLLLAQTASAAPRSVQSVDPLVSLSLFGTAQARSAVCTAGAAAAAAGAATFAGSAAATQGVAPGCVLPVTAPAPPPVVGQTILPPAASGGLGIGTLPLLLGLAAIAALAAVFLLDGDDNDPDPVSPF